MCTWPVGIQDRRISVTAAWYVFMTLLVYGESNSNEPFLNCAASWLLVDVFH